MQALPALHVGTLWKGVDENDIASNRNLVGSENDDSFVKMNGQGNNMEKTTSTEIRKPSTRQSQVNHRNSSNQIDVLSDENDMSMIKRCRRKMSQTITSFHLTVPNIDRRRNSISLKVSRNLFLLLSYVVVKKLVLVFKCGRNALSQ